MQPAHTDHVSPAEVRVGGIGKDGQGLTAAGRRAPEPAVAATKVRPPRPQRRTLVRERLVQRLAEGAHGPLTVLSAPAGWGKTTALLQWLDQADRPVAWVSLDASDADARRLFDHLLAALDGVLPDADAARAAARAGSDLCNCVVPVTVNALERHARDGVVLVVDDYHHVRDPEAHRAFTALLDAAPDDVHVIVSSRTVPPLRLGRRRAAGTAVEIGPRELAFRPAETRALLNGLHGLVLSPVQLAMVDERVAGWPAGVALVALNLGRTDADDFLEALGRSAQQMEEYLVEEVIERLDGRLAELLSRSAVLERFTPALCEAVVGLPDARALLADARRANLLLVERDGDGDETWCRHHDLLAQLLREELRGRAPEVVPELHARASRWFEEAGLAEQAIAHANRAGDGPRAAALLCGAAVELLGGGRYAAVLRLVEEMPTQRGAHGPFSEAASTLALQLQGAEPSLIYERWQRLDAHRDAPSAAWLALAARAWPFFGRVGEAVDFGLRAYRRQPEPIDEAARHAVAAQLGLVLWFAGEPAEARAVVELHLAAMAFPISRAWAHSALALCAGDEGDEERALRHATEATTIAAAHGGATALEFSVAFQAQVDALRRAGRHDDAAAALEHVERVTGRHPASLHHGFSSLLRAELHLARHERADARRAAGATGDVVGRFPDVGVLAGRLRAVEDLLTRRADDGLAGSAPTKAERRVLELLAADLTVTQIARDLFVSIHTVKSHRRRLYRRLGVDNRADAIATARRRGLL